MSRQVTEDGLEKTFALNHMSYFVVTLLLLPRMDAGGRIVSTSSTRTRAAIISISTICSRRSAIQGSRSMAARNSAISFSRGNWRDGLPARALLPTACIRALSPRASATTFGGMFVVCYSGSRRISRYRRNRARRRSSISRRRRTSKVSRDSYFYKSQARHADDTRRRTMPTQSVCGKFRHRLPGCRPSLRRAFRPSTGSGRGNKYSSP